MSWRNRRRSMVDRLDALARALGSPLAVILPAPARDALALLLAELREQRARIEALEQGRGVNRGK
jgi:hypothetical protein